MLKGWFPYDRYERYDRYQVVVTLIAEQIPDRLVSTWLLWSLRSLKSGFHMMATTDCWTFFHRSQRWQRSCENQRLLALSNRAQQIAWTVIARVICLCFSFALLRRVIGWSNLRHYPTILDLLARVFPRLPPNMLFALFWLVHCVV